MSEAEDSEDKNCGAGINSAKPAASSQKNQTGANASDTAPDGYQFFVDATNLGGGYSFGLGSGISTAALAMDTSLPDWFTAASGGGSVSRPPAQALPDSHKLPESPKLESPKIPNGLTVDSVGSPSPLPPLTPVKPLTAPLASGSPSPSPSLSRPEPAAVPPLPMPAVRKMEGGARPVPLDLHLDPRFSQLTLPEELAQTVGRFFSLNDLDFNGFVDFEEIIKMLEGDELSSSEKQFVQLIYQVGKKIVGERPVPDNSVVPVMSRADFALAFASVLKNVLPEVAAQAKDSAAPHGEFKTFRPTVYAEEDYPLGSIKPQAVRLGTMGDAYFAACLISLIDLQPRSIMRMINAVTDQAFVVNLPGLHSLGIDLLPPRAEEIIHYGLAEKYGYWYPLLEKAHGIYVAKHHQLATSMEHGSDPFPRTAQAIEALTGSQTGLLVGADFAPEDLRARILEILSRGKIVVAISHENISKGAIVAGAAPVSTRPYAVQGYDKATSLMVVRGVGTVNTADLNEPVLRLTTGTFAQYFKLIYFEKDSVTAEHQGNDLHMTRPAKNPWRKLPGE